MLNVATIYFLDNAFTAADGLPSSLVCDEAIHAARSIAAFHRKSVVVEDVPARQRLKAMRGRSESYSNVIIRVAPPVVFVITLMEYVGSLPKDGTFALVATEL